MSLTDRFQALDAFLLEHQPLWRPAPFTQRVLPWEAEHPALAAWLRRRSLAEAEHDQGQPFDTDAPAPFPAWAARARALAQLDALPTHPLPPPDPHLTVDVPGRKWQQIQAFAECLDFAQPPRHWLDWCAGKGHLGRRLAYGGARLTCLEWDPALVEAGQHLSRRLGLDAEHRCQDVLAADAARHLQREHSPVALHACGDLHVRLIEAALDKSCAQLAIAPCCYNRIQGTAYRPLSRAARASRLQLDLDALRLPLRETATAGARVRRQRDQSMAWRLGFDLLQRDLRQRDDYLPVPSVPPGWLQLPFADYCRQLADLKHLPAPAERDWAALERAGWQRLAEVRNLELVPALFRRPLELWLLLDRALRLEESGYRVRLGTFCAPHLTPRNVLILAERT